METKDYPSLYQSADKASLKAQQSYLWLMGLDLIFMIIGALIGIYSFQDENNKVIVYSISGFFLLLSLIFTIILRTKMYEDIWYQGRALTESVKTLTWRYMTCSELFEINLEKEETEKRFINRMGDLSNEFKDLNKVLNAKLLQLPPITDKMRTIRNLSTEGRRKYYVENRIQEQKKWYSTNAEVNKSRYNLWFWVIMISQFLSLVAVGILIKNPNLNWNLIGLFTTLSASTLSWLQLKQHQELKQAYTTATIELNNIQGLSHTIRTEDELSKYVLDSENAISREHTLWLAQKRK